KVSIDLESARKKCRDQMQELYEKTLKDLGLDHAKIFAAYDMLLGDQILFAPIRKRIENGDNPIAAVQEECNKISQILSSKRGEYIRQRADDIRYVGEMLVKTMSGTNDELHLPSGNKPFILASYELTPADTMKIDVKRLGGLITELGGATSHTVILAKSLGIPAVIGVKSIAEYLSSGETGILDGDLGEVIVDPDEETKKFYERKMQEDKLLKEKINDIKNNETTTKDGARIQVCANIGNPDDLKQLNGMQFDGIGLFRSEFLYSSKSEKPSYEAQKEAYQKVIDTVYPNNVIIRTLDIGGDKVLSYLSLPKEENPFLGNRGIRLCLEHRDLFREQLKAIITSAAGKTIKIMLPMITNINEIDETRKELNCVKQELDEDGIPYSGDIRLGIMIETPASAIMAKSFAKHCDFFSIGTNDLIQYVMSADRGNSYVQNIYTPYHPAVIKMIAETISAGNDAGIEVGVCGDLASDTKFTSLLLGLGLKKFSVPGPMVGRIKFTIGNILISDAKKLAEKVLMMENPEDIKKVLDDN
ncbi:MAG: phosphoenolpyruvate--protein phosphotransferase, partial [Bacillota bacterium]|nr:phosphoenolpyruvate--protein phosphotransferase [Bacillota bacterium]